VQCCLREGEGGGQGTGSDPLDGAAGERALHGCRWRERVEMEKGSTDGKREREASWLGSLLRAVPFGRGKREEWWVDRRRWVHPPLEEEKDKEGKKKKGKRKGKEKSKLDLLFYLFIIIIKIFKPYPRISVF
jgi:hypothetical protein